MYLQQQLGNDCGCGCKGTASSTPCSQGSTPHSQWWWSVGRDAGMPYRTARGYAMGHDGIGDVGVLGMSTGTLLIMGALGVFAYFQLFKKGR